MDFAFAPGATGYDNIMRTMFTNRASTTLVNTTGVNSIKDFFNHLSTHVSPPLTNILIGTHGNESGWMNVQLDPAFDAHTTYEALEKAFAPPTRSCQLADNIINPRPVDSNNQPIDPSVFIRGCRIGVMTPFIQKLKDVINGLSTTDVGVAAPLFYHVVYSLAQGVFEAFNYDFHIFKSTSVANKTDLVALLDAVGYTDMYGTDITTAQWNIWVPSRITKAVDPLVRVKLNPSPVTRLTTLKAGRYKFQRSNVVTLRMDPSVGTLPTTQGTIVPFLKTLMNNQAANAGTDAFWLMFQNTHPLPFYKRYEYDSLDDMVDGLEWILNSKSRVYTGRRYEYYVSPPVINNNANNELVFNFYASPAGGATSSNMFADDESDYFNKI
ncbi:hypothetical protein FW778_13010 [Ginsengibacter hankyongi]|uniref:Uncharacterized protein n=1 Tax=Ginsengibacter hankyongi TaxID=2607284 RepID=A0A5J5IGX9_9BACT|nr:hypothetical protein [Ginsengibacter hankyongi]KAA9038476.1 hypothetical protein FW778_13010 [Ginsengibacter hankyongi]